MAESHRTQAASSAKLLGVSACRSPPECWRFQRRALRSAGSLDDRKRSGIVFFVLPAALKVQCITGRNALRRITSRNACAALPPAPAQALLPLMLRPGGRVRQSLAGRHRSGAFSLAADARALVNRKTPLHVACGLRKGR